jgi:hypothetical protein
VPDDGWQTEALHETHHNPPVKRTWSRSHGQHSINNLIAPSIVGQCLPVRKGPATADALVGAIRAVIGGVLDTRR